VTPAHVHDVIREAALLAHGVLVVGQAELVPFVAEGLSGGWEEHLGLGINGGISLLLLLLLLLRSSSQGSGEGLVGEEHDGARREEEDCLDGCLVKMGRWGGGLLALEAGLGVERGCG